MSPGSGLRLSVDTLPAMSQLCGAENQLKHPLRSVGDLVVNRHRSNSARGKLIRHDGDAVNDAIGIGSRQCDAAGVHRFGTLESIANRNGCKAKH